MIANIIYLAARMNSQISTLIGVSALIFWSTLVGMLRLSSDQFGPIYSVTYIYTLSAIILFLLYGLPDFNKSSKQCLKLPVICLSLRRIKFYHQINKNLPHLQNW